MKQGYWQPLGFGMCQGVILPRNYPWMMDATNQANGTKKKKKLTADFTFGPLSYINRQ